MPIIFLLSFAIAIYFAVHVVRTGQPMFWLLILLMFPFLGSLVYFITIYLPDMRNSRAAAAVVAGASKLVDPDREYREAMAAHAEVPTTENKRRLAQVLVGRGDAAGAVRLYRESLQGMYANDPGILEDLARAQLAGEDHKGALDSITRLREHNPDYHSAEAHLVLARALEGVGRTDEAIEEYQALAGYYPGLEPRCRLALALQRRGQVGPARSLFEEIVRTADRAPKHVRDAQKDWIKVARSNLA
ncbi:tetratricopeptide repeat protein [Aerophototrophica crusticola]|uniref:Tetratricopeptide repeat protein n=1 Tax=Aerophototrophica crusticola TaxID=1709002 RepID=A0A858R637_9PROT|nr:tetratricopeptide repeat protein [Rhodospirillaceae bacterium B3]